MEDANAGFPLGAWCRKQFKVHLCDVLVHPRLELRKQIEIFRPQTVVPVERQKAIIPKSARISPV
jgi:hypothetical protein